MRPSTTNFFATLLRLPSRGSRATSGTDSVGRDGDALKRASVLCAFETARSNSQNWRMLKGESARSLLCLMGETVVSSEVPLNLLRNMMLAGEIDCRLVGRRMEVAGSIEVRTKDEQKHLKPTYGSGSGSDIASGVCSMTQGAVDWHISSGLLSSFKIKDQAQDEDESSKSNHSKKALAKTGWNDLCFLGQLQMSTFSVWATNAQTSLSPVMRRSGPCGISPSTCRCSPVFSMLGSLQLLWWTYPSSNLAKEPFSIDLQWFMIMRI